MRRFEQRVSRGIEYLNKTYPGWRQRIDLDTLSLIDCELCVLGQLTGYYSEAVDRMRRSVGDNNLYAPAQIGFTLQCSEIQNEADCCGVDYSTISNLMFAELTAEWKRQIGELVVPA